MNMMHNHKMGIVFGLLLGFMHFSWSILVTTGVAQTILDWIYKIHFLNNPFTVAPFNIGTAATLVVFTFIVGYVLGWLFGLLWSVLHKGQC
ncbi:hypothetical protein HZA43_03035 [Candidatus Peregrinibacteria bacterium]|nr:hypothetical protein [Candidatus Peregrinibacteria bacterium]